MAKKKAAPEAQQLTFEQALEQLEASVQQLEEGELGLGESLERYQQCVGLLKQGHSQLEEATRQVEVLNQVTAEGEAVTSDFDDQELSLDEKQATRSTRRGAGKKQSAEAQETPVDDDPGLF